jgi:hypothetical protein
MVSMCLILQNIFFATVKDQLKREHVREKTRTLSYRKKDIWDKYARTG